MFSAFIAEIGDWQRRVSSPSNEVVITRIQRGVTAKTQSKHSFLHAIDVTFFFTNGACEPQTFRNDYFLPPPLSCTTLIALLIASVFSVTPSLFAPKSQIFT